LILTRRVTSPCIEMISLNSIFLWNILRIENHTYRMLVAQLRLYKNLFGVSDNLRWIKFIWYLYFVRIDVWLWSSVVLCQEILLSILQLEAFDSISRKESVSKYKQSKISKINYIALSFFTATRLCINKHNTVQFSNLVLTDGIHNR